jgi:hydrogenase maturation protease
MPQQHQILIAGVGNLLLSDDGVGVHAVRELQQQPIPGVLVVDIGTAILHALSFLESVERVLIIDAARGGKAPGTVYLFEADRPPTGQPMTSIHAMGLREALRLLPLGKSRPRLAILGVEPQSLAYGMNLTAPVQAALPRVISLARETVAAWQAAELRNRSDQQASLTEAHPGGNFENRLAGCESPFLAACREPMLYETNLSHS